jgi:ATP phosphoribosyltransferase
MSVRGKLRVAVPKGAIFEDALRALGRAGLPVEEIGRAHV